MPFNRVAFTKVSHLSFSVRDLLVSVGWYRSVLGLQELDYVEGADWKGVLLVHEPSAPSPTRALAPVPQGNPRPEHV